MVGKSRSGIQQYWLRPLGLDDIPVITKWLADVEDLAMFDRRVPMPLNRASMEAEWQNDIVGREPRTCYWFMIDDDQTQSGGESGGFPMAMGDGRPATAHRVWLGRVGEPSWSRPRSRR